MHSTDMSAVQQRTMKLQKIISEQSSNEAKLDSALACEVYDIQARRVAFAKVLSREIHGTLPIITRTSSDLTGRSGTPTTSNTSKLDQLDQRILVIFIRHFLCGHCQEYLLRLSSHPLLSKSSLAKQNLKIVVIGCGSPSHIASYRALTRIPDEWTLYADPMTDLYSILGMQRSLKMGDRRPVYIQRTMTGNMLRSVFQGVKRIPKGDVSKAGAWDVNGGEFLFEWQGNQQGWTLKWCHQMENSRDHTEIQDLVSVLGLNPMPSSPIVDTAFSENPSKLHTRSQSTPLILENDSVLNQKLEAQGFPKRRFSIRRTLSTRPHSWFERPR